MAGRPRTALVTGASTGIGEATARHLVDRGWTVYASVRQQGEAPPGTAELVFDVTDPERVRAAAAKIAELDALVDNAGIAVAAPLEFLPPDEAARSRFADPGRRACYERSRDSAISARCSRPYPSAPSSQSARL